MGRYQKRGKRHARRESEKKRIGHDVPSAFGENIFVFPAHHADGNFTAFVQCVRHHRVGAFCQRRIGGRGGLDGVADQSDGQPVYGAFGGGVYCGGAMDRRGKRTAAGPRGTYRHPACADRRGDRGSVRRLLFQIFADRHGRPAGQRSAPFHHLSADLFCGNALQPAVQFRLFPVPRARGFAHSPAVFVCGGSCQRGPEHLFCGGLPHGRGGRGAGNHHRPDDLLFPRAHPPVPPERALPRQSEKAAHL